MSEIPNSRISISLKRTCSLLMDMLTVKISMCLEFLPWCDSLFPRFSEFYVLSRDYTILFHIVPFFPSKILEKPEFLKPPAKNRIFVNSHVWNFCHDVMICPLNFLNFMFFRKILQYPTIWSCLFCHKIPKNPEYLNFWNFLPKVGIFINSGEHEIWNF